jgi:adenine phosphoribosyltransferase
MDLNTTLLRDPAAFRAAIDQLAARYQGTPIDVIASIESRGHLFAAPLAYQLGVGLAPVRKPGKLPHDKIRVSYQLEYGSESLEMHRDAIEPGQRVLIVDDLIATGGSARAALQLVEQLGGEVVGLAFLIELLFLNGRDALQGYDVFSVVQY